MLNTVLNIKITPLTMTKVNAKITYFSYVSKRPFLLNFVKGSQSLFNKSYLSYRQINQAQEPKTKKII